MRKTLSLIVLLSASMLASACSPGEPWLMEQSYVQPGKMTIAQSRHIVRKPLNTVSDGDLRQAATTFKKSGHGMMYAVIGYDVHNAAQKNESFARGKSIAQTLRDNGITDDRMVVRSIPVSTAQPIIVIAFDKTEAGAAPGCQPMPSLDGPIATKESFDYRLGCGVQSVMARQLVDPMDLKGKTQRDNLMDGERVANIVTNDYRIGQTRDFLPTYIISAMAGNGQ